MNEARKAAGHTFMVLYAMAASLVAGALWVIASISSALPYAGMVYLIYVAYHFMQKYG